MLYKILDFTLIISGRIPKPKYDYVYVVDVQHFEPELSSNTFQMSGPYRMVVTSNDVKFFAVGSSKPVCFLISSIRGKVFIFIFFYSGTKLRINKALFML